MKNDFFQTWFINTPKESAVKKQYQKKTTKQICFAQVGQKKYLPK